MAEVDDPPRSGTAAQCRVPLAPHSSTANGPRPRVVVVSDICLLREGIVLALTQESPFDVVGAAVPEDAPGIIAAQRPDVVLLDACVVGGRGMPRLLKGLSPDLHVVVFALADGEADIVGWAEAGANGYVGRDGTADDLIAAVQGAMRGEVFCSPRLVGLLFARVAQLSEGAAPDAGAGGLTPREQEILVLVAQGLPNKEIARRLGIGHATVKNHVHRVLGKTQARGRGEASARMRRGEETTPHPTSRDQRRRPPT